MFDLKNLKVISLKKFNNTINYFNPSSNGDIILYRKETKYRDNEFCISKIVDHNDNIILDSHEDDKYYYIYEDARIFDNGKIGVCIVKRSKENPSIEVEVSYGIYDLITKQLYSAKTQNGWAEKHWQLYNDKIIYHINPYTILDLNENVLLKKEINWTPWIEKYGKPGLSTNVFCIENKKYLFFHSYIEIDKLHYKYYIGLLRLNDDLTPDGYYLNPFFECDKSNTDESFLNNFWKWRETKFKPCVKYEIIFPMSIVTKTDSIEMYAGLNDCESVKIIIDNKDFVNKVNSNELYII